MGQFKAMAVSSGSVEGQSSSQKLQLQDRRWVKCGGERDMMVPTMGTILTSETVQTARTETPNGVEVSVVIPCLNEANSLAHCVDKAMKAFREAGLPGEVVVADNGSTDGSIEIAEQRGDHGRDWSSDIWLGSVRSNPRRYRCVTSLLRNCGFPEAS